MVGQLKGHLSPYKISEIRPLDFKTPKLNLLKFKHFAKKFRHFSNSSIGFNPYKLYVILKVSLSDFHNHKPYSNYIFMEGDIAV